MQGESANLGLRFAGRFDLRSKVTPLESLRNEKNSSTRFTRGHIFHRTRTSWPAAKSVRLVVLQRLILLGTTKAILIDAGATGRAEKLRHGAPERTGSPREYFRDGRQVNPPADRHSRFTGDRMYNEGNEIKRDRASLKHGAHLSMSNRILTNTIRSALGQVGAARKMHSVAHRSTFHHGRRNCRRNEKQEG